MTINLLWLVVYLAVLAPLLTFARELAHVAVALALVGQDVIVRIGARPTVQLFKWGRLRVLLQPWAGWVGTWVWDADEMELDKAHYIWMVLAGPVASLLMAFLFAAQRNAFRDGPTIAYALAEAARVGAMVSVALTAIPIKYPSWLYGQPGVISADSLHYQFGLACADCHMPAVASPDGRLARNTRSEPGSACR